MKKFRLTGMLGMCLLLMWSNVYADEYPPGTLNKYSFTLVYGAEHDVCRAYLEELNASPVKVEPYCPRFIDFKSEDFTPLKWVRMDTEFLYKMHEKVDNFIAYKDQDRHRVQYPRKAVRKPSKDEKAAEGKPKEGAAEAPKRPILGAMSAWRSEPPVDIDNDGKVDSFVIWQKGHCNSIDRPSVSGVLIFDESFERIDSKRMFSIIQHPDKGWKEAPNVKRFRFLTYGMGIFAYRGKSYLDGFPGKSESSFTKPAGADLEVFLHEKGETKLICGYNWHGGQNND